MSLGGNLVKNSGFELGLAFWQVPPTLTSLVHQNVRVADAGLAHSGLSMLAMGGFDPAQPAVIYQEVPVSPGRFYQLNLSVSGASLNPASLEVTVVWLDAEGNEIGLGLSIFVPAATVGSVTSGAWSMSTGVTDEAPVRARKARIAFTKGSGTSELFLDDISFFEVAR